MIADKHNQGWSEYTNNLEKQNKHLRELLRRLLAALEGESSISHKDYVELKRQVREELGDA